MKKNLVQKIPITWTKYNQNKCYIHFMIDQFFWWCVGVLMYIGTITGMGYNMANIVIFVIFQPGLILLFFILWRMEKKNIK